MDYYYYLFVFIFFIRTVRNDQKADPHCVKVSHLHTNTVNFYFGSQTAVVQNL